MSFCDVPAECSRSQHRRLGDGRQNAENSFCLLGSLCPIQCSY